jgi:hypothetical protein
MSGLQLDLKQTRVEASMIAKEGCTTQISIQKEPESQTNRNGNRDLDLAGLKSPYILT